MCHNISNFGIRDRDLGRGELLNKTPRQHKVHMKNSGCVWAGGGGRGGELSGKCCNSYKTPGQHTSPATCYSRTFEEKKWVYYIRRCYVWRYTQRLITPNVINSLFPGTINSQKNNKKKTEKMPIIF